MLKTRNCAVLLVAVAIVSVAGTVSAATIIQDSFSRTGDLNLTLPDVGIIPWTMPVPTTQITDGSVLKMLDHGTTNTRASMAFDFVPGLVYTLSVDIEVDDNGGRDWMGVGFTNNVADGIVAWGADIYPWVLLRSESQTPTVAKPYLDDFATFLTDPWGPGRQDDNLVPFSNSGRVEIVLDTTDPADYQVTFSFKGDVVRTVNYGSAPPVTGIFLSAFEQSGTFDNLLLTDDSLGGIPEPTTMCLLAFGGLAMLKRRRRA
jgi:hypothetical protein